MYSQSKLGVILSCRALADTLDDIAIYSQHPGLVSTNLGRSAGWFSRMFFYVMGKSPAKGAETLSYLMETPKAQLNSGEYYANKKVKATTPQSYDMEVAAQLLDVCQTYLKGYIHTDSPIFKTH